jgi:hypothetical protein
MSDDNPQVLGPYIESDVELCSRFYEEVVKPEPVFVDRYYRMNPEEDDLLPNGEALRNGMSVLIEDFRQREEIVPGIRGAHLDSALRNSRWCTVANLNVDGENISFIGIYDDGTKMQRLAPAYLAWIVKKETIPVHENFPMVREMVWEAMQLQPEVDTADEIAREICQLFNN